jgi:hypothetical protein
MATSKLEILDMMALLESAHHCSREFKKRQQGQFPFRKKMRSGNYYWKRRAKFIRPRRSEIAETCNGEIE